jgi:hypothetical protein
VPSLHGAICGPSPFANRTGSSVTPTTSAATAAARAFMSPNGASNRCDRELGDSFPLWGEAIPLVCTARGWQVFQKGACHE